jgi:hypothetical protein
MTLMELGRRIHAGDITLEDALREMKEGSSSVLLNWGEDDDLWECSWIVGGIRYTERHFQPRTAVLKAVVKCTLDLVEKVPHDPFRRALTEEGGVVYTDDKPITE